MSASCIAEEEAFWSDDLGPKSQNTRFTVPRAVSRFQGLFHGSRGLFHGSRGCFTEPWVGFGLLYARACENPREPARGLARNPA